jgi:hypothetical protein
MSAEVFYESLLEPQTVRGPRTERERDPQPSLEAECDLGTVQLFLRRDGTYDVVCEAHPELDQSGTWKTDGVMLILEDLGTARGFLDGRVPGVTIDQLQDTWGSEETRRRLQMPSRLEFREPRLLRREREREERESSRVDDATAPR